MKNNKMLKNNLSKEVKDLHSENYNTQMKKSKKTQTNGRVSRVQGSEELIQFLSRFQCYFLQK